MRTMFTQIETTFKQDTHSGLLQLQIILSIFCIHVGSSIKFIAGPLIVHSTKTSLKY